MSITHFSGPIAIGSGGVRTVTGAVTLTPDDYGKCIVMNAAAGATITLPAVSAGKTLDFVVGAAFATTNWIVDSAEGTNIHGLIADMGTTVAGVIAASEDQVNFVASAETVGDWIHLWSDGTNWYLSGACGANGGITATAP